MTEHKAIKDLTELDYDSYIITLPETALMEGYGGLAAIEIDMLIRTLIDSLEAKAAEANAEKEVIREELAISKTRIATLVTEAITHKAEMNARDRLIEQLKARSAAAGEVEELQAAAALLSEQLVEQRAITEDLSAKLIKLEGVNERATESSSQVADLSARLSHATSKLQRMEKDLSAARLAQGDAEGKLSTVTAELLDTATRLKHAEDGLARADKAKQNALAAQKTSLEEQFRGFRKVEAGQVSIQQQELVDLRRKAAELDATNSELSKVRQQLDSKDAALAEKEEINSHLIEINETLEYTAQQQKCVMEEQHLLLGDRTRKLDYAELTIQYLNQQAIYKNDFGRLSVMSLDPTNIKSSDSHAIHPDKPICWWLNSNGLGCIVFLSAEKDDTGEHYLIFPSLMIDFENESKNVMDLIMPPKDTWPAIIEVIDKLDNKEMLDSMARGEAAANLYSSMRNPDAENAMQQAIAIKNKREALQRQFQNKQAQKAAKKAAKKKPVKPTRAG